MSTNEAARIFTPPQDRSIPPSKGDFCDDEIFHLTYTPSDKGLTAVFH